MTDLPIKPKVSGTGRIRHRCATCGEFIDDTTFVIDRNGRAHHHACHHKEK